MAGAAGSYDYVIVGAGTAGCVLAGRLSEDPSMSVLVLEAGPADDAVEIKIPAAFTGMFKTPWDWDFDTVPQPGLGGRTVYHPRMKALGGCSSMNTAIYIRGPRQDFDRWRDEYGATGWGYEDVLPYFIKSESNTRLGPPYHGTDGPYHTEDQEYHHPLTDFWVESALKTGLPSTDDVNGASPFGVGRYEVNFKAGRRWSQADSYLRPAMDRPNLTVQTDTMVTKILFAGKRAVGVAYVHDGVGHVARVSAEVLLAGGAINSPQLLLLSGVGPAAHLREHGIDVVHDLPGVGENLQDHLLLPFVWYTKNSFDLADAAADPAAQAEWAASSTGPLSSNVAEVGAFFASRDDLDAPDLQMHAAGTGFWNYGFDERPAPMFSTVVLTNEVTSRGRLMLTSAEPTAKPIIDPRYYSDRSELEATLVGCRKALEIAKQSPLAEYLDGIFLPKTEDPTDDELVDHIRAYSQTTYHLAATCAMGSGELSVLDPELRVRGTEGLRVVDASSFPRVTRGNINTPIVMLAERGADLILGKTPLAPIAVAEMAAAG